MRTKLLFICALLFTMSQTFAQVYAFEPFDYVDSATSGFSLLEPNKHQNPVTNTFWTDRQGATGDMLIEADPGWAIIQAFDLNPTGNSVHFQGGGEDGVLPFAAPLNISNSGPSDSVYLSFFMDIKGWDVTATNNPEQYRLIHFGVDNGNGGYNAGSGLYVGPGTASPLTTFRIGYNNSDRNNDVVWDTTNYDFTDLGDGGAGPVVNNQFFIVIKFTFGVNSSGGGIDGYMWINPSVTVAEPAADLTQDSSLAERQRSQFDAINFEASSNDRTPDVYFDEIRVTGTWEEATGQPALSVSENELQAAISLYPNPAKDYISINTKNNLEISNVEIYSLLGQKVKSQVVSENNRVDVSSLSKGMYLMKISADGNSITKKIVIE